MGKWEPLTSLFASRGRFYSIRGKMSPTGFILNLDFEESDDPTQQASDATEWALIANASERGGALFPLHDESRIPAAVHAVRQADEKVLE